MDRKVFRDLSYGMYIIAGEKDDGSFAGCVVNTVIQVTSDPAMITVSVNKDNYTNKVIKDSKKFTVSILSESTSVETIREFGFKTSKDVNKFENVKYELEETGIPIINDGICGWFSCELVDFKDLSTHTVFFAKVIDGQKTPEQNPGNPMTYAYYHNVIKGKAPKNAPTYQAPEKENEEEASVSGKNYRYVCNVCGYEYEGETPFEDLPDDWACPVCGEPKSSFSKVFYD
ncbi:MAG: flavin reductase [Methanosarcinaceae archaeon]|nr:flavin reductase [Methanosarcinaceae archaeon]